MAKSLEIVRRRRLLRGLLALRTPVTDAESLADLAEVAREMGLVAPPRLTASEELPVPAAVGDAEICLPARAWRELTRAERRAVLAHEAAHLARRDPAWLRTAGVLGAVLWLQPLHGRALREWGEAADFLCDARAARATGRPRSLARALARVAAWLPATPPAPAAPALASLLVTGSPLVRRVERLLASDDLEREWLRTAVLVASVCALLALAAAGPAVRLVRPGAGLPRASEERVVVVRTIPPAAPARR